MLEPLCLCVAPLASIALLMAPAVVPQDAVAPDGKRGLGEETETSDLLKLFRQPSDEDEVFLASLRELEPRLSVLRATASSLYTERGWFSVLEDAPHDELAALHVAFDEFLKDPEPVLVGGGDVARVYAELLFDTRFRTRAHVLLGWEEDVEDLRRGLALLSGATDGWVWLYEGESGPIARRVDLAAALLRARVNDLDALREETEAPSSADPASVSAFLELGNLPAGTERQAAIDQALAEAHDAGTRMQSLLFTTRLRDTTESLRRWRADQDRAAALVRDQVRVLQPQTEEGRKASAEIRRLKKTDRRRQAYAGARQGLAFDPFDDELALAAARMSLFVAGELESLNYYDRFLALRGVRVYDERTWRGNQLDDDEMEAVSYIQQVEREDGRLPVPDPLGG